MAREGTLIRLAQLAQDQWGLVTRRQAEHATVSSATIQRLGDKGVLERVANGVYRLSGAPIPDHLELRAAWLQLAPEVPAWRRTADQGVVSHRSAASLYGLGHLPADVHEFTLSRRRQSRRPDVRLHKRAIAPGEHATLGGLPVTRPARIASDLLRDREDPQAVAHVVSDAIRGAFDHPSTFVDALAPHAAGFGLRHGDGLALLRWILGLVGDPDVKSWLEEARADAGRTAMDEAARG